MRVAGRPGLQSVVGAWREKGFRDGLAGRDANTTRIVVDEHSAAYMAGYRQGAARANGSSVREPKGREAAVLTGPSPMGEPVEAGEDIVLDDSPSSTEVGLADAGSRTDEQAEEA